MTRTILTAAALAALGAAAFAGDTFDSTGQGTGTDMGTLHEVAEGHVVLDARTEFSKFEMADEGHPLNAMSGPCFGTVEVKREVTHGGGQCVLSGGGETAVLDWMPEAVDAEGRNHGTWTVSGGTGPWEKATGGGTYVSTTDPATGEVLNEVTGAITLP